MKYLCLGYYDSRMDGLSRPELDALMGQCRPHMETLYETGQVIVDAGLAPDSRTFRRVKGKLRVVDGPYAETKEVIGGAVLIEARDMDDAVRVASLHPVGQVADGEKFGWGMQIRPVHYFRGVEQASQVELEASVAQMIERYRHAVFDKDVEAFVQLYDEGVRAFDAWNTWSYEGAAAWRKMAEGWFASLGTERVGVTAEDVRVMATAGLASLSATFTYTGLSADGDTLRSLKNRISWVLRAESGAWKILHEHTSIPR